MSTNSRIGKRVSMVNTVTVMRTLLQPQDISNWRNAVNQARDRMLPRRRLLHELYENMVLDGHLASVMQTRTVGITNKRLLFRDKHGKDGEVNEDVVNNVLNTPWFHDLLEGAMSAVSYGTTVLELVMEAGVIKRVAVIPRANVVPEKSLVLTDVHIPDLGVNYAEDPYWKRFLIPVGRVDDYGLLMTASQYIILKRGGFAAWAQFAELFGMPLRVGKYNPYDQETRAALDDALANMGSAGYIVIPDGANIEFQESSGTGQGGGGVYNDMIATCNAEISKVFLGGTLTTDAGEKGARSLGDVHKASQEEIAMADMRRIEHLLNWEVKPRLAALGYPVADGEFVFSDTIALSLEQRIKIDLQVSSKVDISPDYWYQTYGVPKPTPEEAKAIAENKAAAAALLPPKGKKEVPEEEQEEEENDPPKGARAQR